MIDNNLVIAWFSCGVTSAVACKLALQEFENVRVFYIDTEQMHKDSYRFLHDCERWFNKEIEIVKSSEFNNPFEVWEKKRFINSIHGAPCTLYLKKRVRYKLEDELIRWKHQVLGYDVSEKNRADKFVVQYPNTRAIFPLIEKQLSKSDCMGILQRNNIEIPKMYKLGFHNNNCIGCCKGGKGYWAAIRKYFPEQFAKMVALEKKIGHSCINGMFLEDLPDNYKIEPIVPSCSLFCDVDFL